CESESDRDAEILKSGGGLVSPAVLVSSSCARRFYTTPPCATSSSIVKPALERAPRERKGTPGRSATAAVQPAPQRSRTETSRSRTCLPVSKRGDRGPSDAASRCPRRPTRRSSRSVSRGARARGGDPAPGG